MILKAKKSRKKLVIGVSLVVVVGAGLAFYMLGGVEKVRAAFQPKTQNHSITLKGKLVCLPRQDGGETSALSCAFGMQAEDGKYYGLSGSKDTALSDAAGTSKNIELSGELRSPTDATYKMEGIVAVDSFKLSD